MVREQARSGASLYSLKEETLHALKPDLIVTQAVCNVCAVSDADVTRAVKQMPGAPQVLNLEPNNLAEVFDSLELVGKAAGAESRASEVVEQLRSRVARVRNQTSSLAQLKSVVFLEWIDPPFCAGHWTPELIRFAGGKECLGESGSRSRTITWRDIIQADPDALVLACCGFDVPRTLLELPSLENRPEFQTLRCVRNGAVYVIDGNAYFNRPGPRLVDGLEVLANALHESVHPLPAHLEPAYRVQPNAG
ncbi:MAG TPA: cobalamin-binding protein [Planctomycetaceae bacterium]|nr:cobalamin-binding protein [Planctomycetaceae bacterium]